MSNNEERDPIRFVAVTLERRERTHKQWSYVEWKATGVVPARADDDEYRTLIHTQSAGKTWQFPDRPA